MKYEIQDPDVLMLVSIAATFKGDYIREGTNDPWAGSPFAAHCWVISKAVLRQHVIEANTVTSSMASLGGGNGQSPAATMTLRKAAAVSRAASSGAISLSRWLNGSTVSGPS